MQRATTCFVWHLEEKSGAFFQVNKGLWEVIQTEAYKLVLSGRLLSRLYLLVAHLIRAQRIKEADFSTAKRSQVRWPWRASGTLLHADLVCVNFALAAISDCVASNPGNKLRELTCTTDRLLLLKQRDKNGAQIAPNKDAMASI